MREIKLHRLILRNFKGMTFTLEAQGSDIDVFGANASGKTTLADAFSWLLFDKDSTGHAEFEIKNLDATGEAEHGLEHSVESLISVDGEMTAFKKVYHEVWSKKRGSAQATFTGHTVDYFINGVPVKAGEYLTHISQAIADENTFRLLTSPTVFPSLPWQKQRSLLLEICGDVSDLQVIETDSTLTPLIDLLKKYTVSKTPIDDLKKVVMSGRTEINRKLEQLPVRIDEASRGLPDVTGLNKQSIDENVTVLENLLNDAKLRLSGVDNGSNIADLSKKLVLIDADLQKIERDYYNDAFKSISKLDVQINTIRREQENAERERKEAAGRIELKENAIAGLESRLNTLRERWTAIDAEMFKDTIDTVCAACGQSLPENRVEEARDKARAAFNLNKADRLAEIEKKGKELKAEQNQLQVELNSLKERVSDDTTKPETNIEQLISDRDALKRMAEDYASIPEWNNLTAQKKEIEQGIKDAKESISMDRDEIAAQIADLEEQLRGAKALADVFPRREQGEKRVEELKAEEKKLTREFEQLEKTLYLIENFIKRKVSLLTDRINGKFEIARFKLFDTQVNGGIAECCEITVNGVGYNSGLNNAMRINAGLDVCRTLARHYGLTAPIFVDNAESVCELLPMEAQVIRLVVSEKDKQLRIEAANKARRAA